MTYPISITVSFDFSSGPNFDPPFLIGISQLGIGVLGAGGQASEVVDLSQETTSIRIKRGRDLIQDRFNPGICTVRVLDFDGSWNPQNSASPYFGLLQPLRKMVIAGTYEGITYPLFAGYTTAYSYQYPKNEELGYIDIQCVDALSLFNKSAVTTVTGAADGDTTGDRVDQILDQIGFPGSQRIVDTGTILVQDDPGNLRTVLQALQDVEFTEYGAVYVDARGDVIFRDRADVVQTTAGAPTVFDQTTGINYTQIKFSFDDRLIFNAANFTRVGGTTQTYFDQSSIDNYFPHAITREYLLHQTDTETLDLAKAYVSNRSVTDIRIDSLMLDLSSPDYGPGIEAALGLDFFAPIEVTNVQPGGSTITKTLQVFGVEHNITSNSWMTTLTTGDPILTGFIIGSSVYGLLGESRL